MLFSLSVKRSWLIHAIFSEVSEIERFLTAKVTFKVPQGNWY